MALQHAPAPHRAIDIALGIGPDALGAAMIGCKGFQILNKSKGTREGAFHGPFLKRKGRSFERPYWFQMKRKGRSKERPFRGAFLCRRGTGKLFFAGERETYSSTGVAGVPSVIAAIARSVRRPAWLRTWLSMAFAISVFSAKKFLEFSRPCPMR